MRMTVAGKEMSLSMVPGSVNARDQENEQEGRGNERRLKDAFSDGMLITKSVHRSSKMRMEKTARLPGSKRLWGT